MVSVFHHNNSNRHSFSLLLALVAHDTSLPTPLAAPPAQLNVDDLPIVKRYLCDLGRDELIDLGVELGLRYPNLQLMTSLKNEMVTAWLKSEDNVVRFSGPPCWASLVRALRNINQNGIASKIEIGKSSLGMAS